MTLESRVAALLEVVQAQRDTNCRGQVEPARERARALLRQARRAARARVHGVIAEERAACASRITRAEAQLATRRRMVYQELARALLREGHEQLAAALARRWTEDESRRRWIDGALGRALEALPLGAWTIACPAGWSGDERRAVAARLLASRVEANFIDDASIDAGLRIASGKVVLDATKAGLLEDRVAVEGRLLDLIAETGS